MSTPSRTQHANHCGSLAAPPPPNTHCYCVSEVFMPTWARQTCTGQHRHMMLSQPCAAQAIVKCIKLTVRQQLWVYDISSTRWCLCNSCCLYGTSRASARPYGTHACGQDHAAAACLCPSWPPEPRQPDAPAGAAPWLITTRRTGLVMQLLDSSKLLDLHTHLQVAKT